MFLLYKITSVHFKRLYMVFFFMLLFSVSSHAQQMTPEAFVETKAACEERNDGAECSKLYYYYISSKRRYVKGLKADKKKALAYAVKGCELNDKEGCFAAGMDYYYGDEWSGIDRDKEKGRALLKKACELGMDDVCSYFLNPKF